MAYILCIETATTNCSVAIAKDGVLITVIEDYDNKYSHAEKLHNYITKAINEAKITLQDIDAIAISKGPGSYTGLRIGVSSAKGLCYALDIPLISIPTLTSLVQQTEVENVSGIRIPMLDARRMEVYTAVFSDIDTQIEDTTAKILDETSFKSYLDESKVYFIGDGTEKFAKICTHENAVFIHDKLPSAKNMAMLSYKKFVARQFEDVTYFEPYYLKDFVVG